MIYHDPQRSSTSQKATLRLRADRDESVGHMDSTPLHEQQPYAWPSWDTRLDAALALSDDDDACDDALLAIAGLLTEPLS